jgi:hypothetical protein
MRTKGPRATNVCVVGDLVDSIVIEAAKGLEANKNCPQETDESEPKDFDVPSRRVRTHVVMHADPYRANPHFLTGSRAVQKRRPQARESGSAHRSCKELTPHEFER